MFIISENLYISDNGFVLDYYTGFNYKVNDTGTFIFKQLQNGIPFAQIMQNIKNKYGVSHETATTGLNDFIQQMTEYKLLKPSEARPDDTM